MDLPYIEPSIASCFPFQQGDVVISVPIKCGTNWTMFLVYSILTRGDTTFADLYDHVPWLEFKWNVRQTLDERIRRLKSTDFRSLKYRTFKSHLPLTPGPLPVLPGVKYIVTCRNPFDTVLSLAPFFLSHTDEFFDAWGMRNFKENFDSFEKVLDNFISGIFPPDLAGFYKSAWDHRDSANVLLLHFTNLKQSTKAEAKRVAAFLDQELNEDTLEEVVGHCEFGWMKAHEEKFELRTIGYVKENGEKIPILNPGSLLRKGATGENEGVLSDEQRQKIFEAFRERCNDADLLDWIFHGRH